ncbi:MAG: ATP-dependent helicase HrpB [Rhodospirillales bacterium 69-11]|nr:MAG: ATP-dependent helicase HrpB [Rhodospirillales bacterium 69-11]
MTALPDLPVTEALPRLHAALDAGRNAVLVAPPGAGKTTLVPLALLDAPWRGDQRILMLEPRRLATRAAATRMASLRGEAVGGRIGFRTRIEGAGSPATRVEVVTEGLLVRRLQSDPGLDGVAAVILDEVHERSLESDLALALCLDLQRMLRPELRLLAMSATADGARLSGLMEAEVVESAGRMFPVTVQHASRDIATARDLPEAMARAIRAALAEHAGDILAFLPGMAEIRRTQAALDRCGALVLPLHGELPPADQDRALRPAEGRRVVLATSIAETSLTVPGVRIVVDGGFRRAPRLDQATGLTRLATLRISRAAAEQRAGRAGREAPGVAIRLWSQALHRGLPPFDRPEILEAELSGLALDCAAWGTPPADLPFQDRPPAGALAAAGALLADLGALDAAGRITAAGREMARLGAHPRLAAMLLAADGPDERAMAADLAALLEERDPLRSPEAPCDVALRLAAIAYGDAEADRAALARIRRAADQYRRRLRTPAGAPSSPLPFREGARGRGPGGQNPDHAPTPIAPSPHPSPARGEGGGHGPSPLPSREGARGRGPAIPDDQPSPDPGRLLAAAFPDRIAQRRGEPGSFRLSGGGGAKLPRLDPLANAPLLVVAALEMKASARIRLAAPLDPDALPPVLAGRVTEQVEGGLDPATGSVHARRRRRLGALILSDRTEPADPQAIADALARAAAADLRALPWTEAARQFQARIGWMREVDAGSGWPDLSDAALAATAADWLAPHLLGLAKLADLQRLDLLGVLRGLLPWPLPATLDQALPTHLALPGGRAAIDYAQPVPQAEARAQAFYGLTETPRLAGGRVPLRLALLSPAGRPVAVTADLAQFWTGGWADVRRDMRGRYPKHRWPENPARADDA